MFAHAVLGSPEILRGYIVLDPDDTMLESLTDEEHLEVTNIVTLLESAQEDSLQHFEIDQNTTSATRHKNVCNEELDRLASKNSAFQQPTRQNGLLLS